MINGRSVGTLPSTRISTVPLPSQNAIVPVTYQSAAPSAVVPYKKMEEPVEIQVYEPEEKHTFLGDTWQGVVKPVGIGIASPVVGAGAMVGGAVVGAGVFVGSCVYGLFSTARGIVGIIPIGIDYGVKPIGNLLDRGAHGVDNSLDKVLDPSLPSLPSWSKSGEEPSTPVIIEELPSASPPRLDNFRSPSKPTNLISAASIPPSTTYLRPSTMTPTTMPYLNGSSLPGSRREVGRYIS